MQLEYMAPYARPNERKVCSATVFLLSRNIMIMYGQIVAQMMWKVGWWHTEINLGTQGQEREFKLMNHKIYWNQK
jgi:hypothetical protein